MRFRSTTSRWGLVAASLHWIMAAAIIAMLVLGTVMVNYPMSTTKLKLFAAHKSIGFTLLVLVWIRLLWRLADRRPDWPDGLTDSHRVLARGAHVALYLLMVLVPLSGWLINAASGFPLNWFGLYAVPSPMAPDETLQLLAERIHLVVVITLATIVSLHVAGALYHQFARRNGLIRRMWIW